MSRLIGSMPTRAVGYTTPAGEAILGTPQAPSRSAFAVTPSASDPLPSVTRWVYVGGAGSLVVRLADDSADVTLAAVPAGTLLPLAATHVRNTSGASSIVGLV